MQPEPTTRPAIIARVLNHLVIGLLLFSAGRVLMGTLDPYDAPLITLAGMLHSMALSLAMMGHATRLSRAAEQALQAGDRTTLQKVWRVADDFCRLDNLALSALASMLFAASALMPGAVFWIGLCSIAAWQIAKTRERAERALQAG